MKVQEIQVVALTHKKLPIEEIGLFTIAPEARIESLSRIKQLFDLKELMYLATCNRVEIIFVPNAEWSEGLTENILAEISGQEVITSKVLEGADKFVGHNAVLHLFRVVASLESMMVGEREIITQFRSAFEFCMQAGLTGDQIRLLAKKCVETAKQIHTRTQMNGKPVSVASFTWKKVKEFAGASSKNLVLVGSGQMMNAISKYLKEDSWKNVTMYNRTSEKAQKVMEPMKGNWGDLNDLTQHSSGCDILVTCTSSSDILVTKEFFKSIAFDGSKKLVIDLSVPSNIEKTVGEIPGVTFISMQDIGVEVSENQRCWENAVLGCEPLIDEAIQSYEQMLRQRRIEKMMSHVPSIIKEIRTTAINEVFAEEMKGLDEKSKALLDEIMDYMEKKYISVPMKMAREVLLTASNT